MRRACGFTLIEILIVIVILGIVAGLAVPVYTNSVEQARQNEAKVNLNAMFMGEKIFALNHNGNFWNGGGTVLAPSTTSGTTNNPALATINGVLNLDLVTPFFNITSITVNNAAKTLTITATRNGNAGGDGVTTVTIDETGVTNPP